MARSGNEKITVRSERTGDTTEGKDCGLTKGERRVTRVAFNEYQHLEIRYDGILLTTPKEKAQCDIEQENLEVRNDITGNGCRKYVYDRYPH
jgi:hypothetical protein